MSNGRVLFGCIDVGRADMEELRSGRTGYVICGAQYKIKIREVPPSKIIRNFKMATAVFQVRNTWSEPLIVCP